MSTPNQVLQTILEESGITVAEFQRTMNYKSYSTAWNLVHGREPISRKYIERLRATYGNKVAERVAAAMPSR